MNCPACTYNENQGATNVEQCIKCEGGLPSEAGSASQRACGISSVCPAGSYFTKSSGGTGFCKECSANTFNSAAGATSTDDCHRCPSDTFSIPGSTSKTDCTADVTQNPTFAPTEAANPLITSTAAKLQLQGAGVTTASFNDEKYVAANKATIEDTMRETLYNEAQQSIAYSVTDISVVDVKVDDSVGDVNDGRTFRRRRLGFVGQLFNRVLEVVDANEPTTAIMLTFKVTADATALDDDATDAGLDVNEVPTAEDMLRVLTESVNTGELGNTLNRYASATDASPSLTTAEALDLKEAEIQNSNNGPDPNSEGATPASSFASLVIAVIAGVVVLLGVCYYQNKANANKAALRAAADATNGGDAIPEVRDTLPAFGNGVATTSNPLQAAKSKRGMAGGVHNYL
jgi:hypothetical protein